MRSYEIGSGESWPGEADLAPAPKEFDPKYSILTLEDYLVSLGPSLTFAKGRIEEAQSILAKALAKLRDSK